MLAGEERLHHTPIEEEAAGLVHLACTNKRDVELQPLLHVIWCIHVDKCRLVFRGGLSTRTHFWKTRTGTLLCRENINFHRSVEISSPFTFDNLSSDNTLQISLYLTTSHGWLPSQS